MTVMKKMRNLAVALLLSTAILTPGCIGSFSLTKSVYEWNNSVGDKFVNELVFLVCLVVPVYQLSTFIDAVVLNSIEFWTGDNPMAMKEGEKREKLVEIEGKTYKLTAEKYKMTIEDLSGLDEKTQMVFREEDNSWYLKKGNKLQKLVEVEMKDGKVTAYHMFYPNGATNVVSPGFDPVAVKDQISVATDLAME